MATKPFQLSKKVNNAIYGYGAAIAIIGNLEKSHISAQRLQSSTNCWTCD